jgi:cob(I)alamin adenosyltransferase
MRLYTGKGDHGETDLLGERVAKDDPRISALGSLDETSSSLGMARALAATEQARGMLLEMQRDLYRLMAELAFTDELRPAAYVLGEDRVAWLEAATDEVGGGVELPAAFVLPGESVPGAALDVARTVARRAERDVVVLAQAAVVTNPQVLRYLNRLSSLLFVLARAEDQAAGARPVVAKTGVAQN